ncbi:Snf7-domain-containing protein [Schizophyllum commune]
MSAFATPAKSRVNALAQGYDSTPRRSNSGLIRTTAPGTPQRMNPNATAQLPPSIESLGPVTISRLQGLYSDFTQKKHTNLASYNANVEWWRKALETHVSSGSASGSTEALASTSATSGSRFVLQANRQLIDAMRVEGVGKPAALGEVITNLVANRTLIPLSTFLSSTQSIYPSSSWIPSPTTVATYVVGKPLWWAMEQLGIVGEDSLVQSITSRVSGSATQSWYGDYVFLSLLEKAAAAILEEEKGDGASDGLYSVLGFRRRFGEVVGGEGQLIGERDAEIILKFMQRDKGVLVADVKQDVVKFTDPSTSPAERAITAVDKGVMQLRTAIESLNSQISALQARMDECTFKAKDALRKGQKTVATTYLRTKKHLEEVLNRRLGSLTTLEGTLISVESARGDVEIMKSYSLSTATLRSILSHPSLQREEVEKTMDALAEANMDAREISETVNVNVDTAVGADAVDEDLVEDELAALIRESEAESKAKEEAGKKAKEEGKEKAQAEETRQQLEKAGSVPEGIQQPEPEKERVAEL